MAAISLLVVWVIGEFIHRETRGVGRCTHTVHAKTHACSHSNILSHTLSYAGEKYINICITKPYKGLSVVKYLFCQDRNVEKNLCGSSLPYVLGLQNYLCLCLQQNISSQLWKIFPQLNGIRGTGLYLYTQKSSPPHLQSLFSKWKPNPKNSVI